MRWLFLFLVSFSAAASFEDSTLPTFPSVEEIRTSWAAPISGVDNEVLLNLNLDAAKIWGKILICKNGDMRLARKGYMAGNYCGSGFQQDEIQRELLELHANLQNFQATSFVDSKVIASSRLPLFHPLFIQTLLESISAQFHFFDNDQRPHSKYLDHFYALQDFNESSSKSGKMLQIDQLGRNTVDQKHVFSLREFPLFSQLILMDLLSKNKCSLDGLWPADSFVLLQKIRFRMWESMNLYVYRNGLKTYDGSCMKEFLFAYQEKALYDSRFIQVYRNLGKRFGIERKPHCTSNFLKSVGKFSGITPDDCDYIE